MKGLAAIGLLLAVTAYGLACMAAYKVGGLAFWILYTAMFS